jgi:sugar lactone lactonase YvrE
MQILQGFNYGLTLYLSGNMIMFKQVFRSTFIALLFSLSISQSFATTGDLFKISSTGGAQVNITLCLNIQGQTPLSCQNLDTQAGTLTISTTIPDHTYYHAGIRINTPGFVYTSAQGLTSNTPLFSSTGFTLACPAGVSSSQTCSGALKSTASTAYIASRENNTLYYCPVNPNNSLESCIPTLTNITFSQIFGVALNPSKSILYVTDWGNSEIYYCPIAESGPTECIQTVSSIANPDGIAINPTGTFAYIVDAINGIAYYCPVNPDGSLGACTPTALSTTPALGGPTGIAINPTGTFAYIVDTTNSIAYYCPVSPDGSLGACTSTAAGTTPALRVPTGITL